MAITYRSVIAKAINDFNDVQNALSTLKAVYPNTTDAIGMTTTSGVKLLETDKLGSIITGQLQLKAVDTVELDENLVSTSATDGYFTSTQDLSAAKFIKIKEATYTVNGDKIQVATNGYVKTGTVAGTVVAAKDFVLSATDDVATPLTIGESKTISTQDYYVVSGSISAQVTGTAGYFSTKGTGLLTDSEVSFGLIKKAGFSATSGDTNTITPEFDSTAVGTGDIASSLAFGTSIDANYEKITVTTTASGTSSGIKVTATEGYVKTATDTPVTATINSTTEGTFDIGVRKAAWSSTRFTASGTNAEVGTTLSNNKYTITATVTGSATPSTNGYTTGTGNLTTTSKVKVGEISKGSVTASVSSMTNTITAGTGISFMSGTPDSKLKEGTDYYKITATSTANLTTVLGEGYIRQNDTVTTNNYSGSGNVDVQYIPAAKFKFVKDVDKSTGTPQTFIQCQTAGYLNTGLLAIVDTDSNPTDGVFGDIDWADVTVKLNESTSILKSGSAVNANAYEITLDLDAVNPGYISGTSGNVALNSKYWIEKASVSSGVVEDSFVPTFEKTVANGVVTSESSTAYKITITPKASVKTETIVSGEGYIKEADESQSAVINSTGTAEDIYIAAATFNGTGKTAAVTTNGTAASGNGSAAVVYANSASVASYVTVSATGYKQTKVTAAGHTAGINTIINGETPDSASAKIAATIGSAARKLEDEGATSTSTSTATTYTVNTQGSTVSHSEGTNTVTVTTTSNVTDSAAKDTYVVGNYTSEVVSTSTLTIPKDATGSDVDDYVTSLYSRMLGFSYTAVTADGN